MSGVGRVLGTLRTGVAAVGTAPGRLITWSERAPRPAAIVAGVAALLLLAGIATFTVLHVREQRTVMARAEAQAVAKEAVPVLLSFDHTSLGGELASREARLTGSFKDDYAKLMRDVVLPAAQQSALITTTELVDSGVAADDGPNRITLLMFVNQSTGPEGRAPDVAGSRVRVTMERPADEWLVSELTPV